MKKGRLILIGLCGIVLLTAICIIIGAILMTNNNDKNGMTPTISATPSGAAEISLLEGDIYYFASNYIPVASTNYLPADYPTDYSSTGKKRPDEFAPKPVTLSWKVEDGALDYTVTIATNEKLSDSVSYVTTEKSLEIPDLYMGTSYYYQISANFPDQSVTSEIFHFKTAQLPRTIDLEGVSNTRDIGGYYTADGHRIRQGMVYRGGRLDKMSNEAKEKALNVYGFKTDLDLRAEATASPLGDSVNFINISAPFTSEAQVYILKRTAARDRGKVHTETRC